MVSRSDADASSDSGSGSASIAGYEYQVDVSVWLALDLVLASKLAEELILEPSSEEDIEADLAEHVPGRVTSTARLDGYRLIVQAKLRGGDAWTVAGVSALLKHGEVRVSAAKRLADPTARYLLVTSAALNGETRQLRVGRAGNWPAPADMPASIRRELPPGAAGRVAIIGNHDEERLDVKIRQLLNENFRVPNARLPSCRKALREEARIRIGGAGGGRWTRAELEQIVRRFDGYIASSPELDDYVHPTNWTDLLGAMRGNHAALIVGQSGTGKTLATRKLYEALRETVPGLTRVAITRPQQLRDDQTELPVLYDIEDPWGRFDFDPESRSWNDQLAGFLARARADRMIVATSRLDVAQSAGALGSVERWLVKLEAEHYGPAERHRLYRTRIDALPRRLQAVADEYQAAVLAELATPLEIQKFFDALPDFDAKALRHPELLVAEAIRRAHRNSIERNVIEQIEQRQDIAAAAVVWGLLKANDRFSQKLLRPFEDALMERGSHFDKGVSPFVGCFVAARNLRQKDDWIAYYHPRVESGIEQALSRQALVAKKALSVLIDSLLAPDGPAKGWGVAASVRLIAAAERIPLLKPKPSQQAQHAIDAWLAFELAKGGNVFETNLKFAAAAGSADSNVAEVARFLLHRPERYDGAFSAWGASPHDDAWYSRVSSDAAVKPLIETFIREVLPVERAEFDERFVAEVERLATDLTPAFLAAAAKAVYFGVTQTSEAIAAGALQDLAGFESVVDAAVQVLTPTQQARREADEIRLAAINGEYSDEHLEHLANNDDGYTAEEFLKAYVDKVRAAGDWHRLTRHPHRAHLLRHWFRMLEKEPAPAADEMAGALATGRDSASEDDLWRMLGKHWDRRFEDALVQRVLDAPPDEAVRSAALSCLVQRVPARLAGIAGQLVAAGGKVALIELAVALGELEQWRDRFAGETPEQAFASVAAMLPAPFEQICQAALALANRQVPVLSQAALDLLQSSGADSEKLRAIRLEIDRHVALPVGADVSWLLAHSNDHDVAVEAIEAAHRHGMVAALEAGLTHRFADVVAHALRSVGATRDAPLPATLLALAHHKGRRVREALVELLDAKPHPLHLPALLLLAKDRWSPRINYYGEKDHHPVAQKAVAAMAKLGAVDNAAADELYRIAIDSNDSDVRSGIFLLLVRAQDSAWQQRLFDLAVSPGRGFSQNAAADALLAGFHQAIPQVVARITAPLLADRTEYVAGRLLLLLAAVGEFDRIVEVTTTLATNGKRRVLLLLALWVLRERDPATAQRIASLLPPAHPAVAWVLDGVGRPLDDAVLQDLGDPLSADQVVRFLKPPA